VPRPGTFGWFGWKMSLIAAIFALWVPLGAWRLATGADARDRLSGAVILVLGLALASASLAAARRWGRRS
jgi:hypothetical protein